LHKGRRPHRRVDSRVRAFPMNLYKMIQYTGIGAVVLLVSTAVTGLARADVEVHEHLGIATVAVGLLHGGLVIYRNMKNKRHVPIIFLILAMVLACTNVYAASMTGILKDNSNAGIKRLTKEQEKNYIREYGLKDDFSIKVTTKNQKKFDRNRDGYLSGRELAEYLRKYD